MNQYHELNYKEPPWINPIGGYGDMLMVSSVIKRVIENSCESRFNLIRRSRYTPFFQGHPGINEIGFPSKDATIIGTNYWAKEMLGGSDQRAFQILARSFGLKTPVEEVLYVPWSIQKDSILSGLLPWKKKNVIIAPSSDSPRKVMSPKLWQQTVKLLNAKDFFVLQVGKATDMHIPHAYSVLGLTTLPQLIGLLRMFDVIITSDNFIMHAAHLVQARAIVLWGATRPEVYGYSEQIHLQGQRLCDTETDCLIPIVQRGPSVYGTPCPLGEKHCMNGISSESIVAAVEKVFN